MTEYTHPAFFKLLEDPENKKCFDCGTIYNLGKCPALWASVNNGVFVCMNCASIHRGFGVDYSYMRSITIDSWNDSQIALLESGGNSRLFSFLKGNKMPSSIDQEGLYKSKIMDYYRKNVILLISLNILLLKVRKSLFAHL